MTPTMKEQLKNDHDLETRAIGKGVHEVVERRKADLLNLLVREFGRVAVQGCERSDFFDLLWYTATDGAEVASAVINRAYVERSLGAGLLPTKSEKAEGEP